MTIRYSATYSHCVHMRLSKKTELKSFTACLTLQEVDVIYDKEITKRYTK